MVSTKKKRVSKKTRASWRKYTDIKDVEEFLEDQRLEERVGKAELKKDDELFTVDTGGDEENLKVVASRKSKRREKAKRPLRSLAILENTSKVDDPIVKRNTVKQRKSGKDVVSQFLAGKTSSRITQAFRQSKQHNFLRRKEKREKAKKIFRNNLWEDKDVLDDHPQLKSEWIDRNLATYHLHKTGNLLIPRPSTADLKTTRAKTLELPHPGMSYNPSLKDHQNLINEVLERESKIIKEEQHLKRVTTDMFKKLTPGQRDLRDMKEATSGLDLDGPDGDKIVADENNIDPDSLDRISINPPVLNKKKDRKSRRKQREQRDLLQERKKLKLEKKKISDIHRLKHITAEVADEEKKTKEIMKSRKVTAEKRKYEPKRLGKLKFQEPEIPVNMISDLTGNLRSMKPESSILVDRFKSMQRRNILPPTVDTGIRKRSKIKRFVRSSHKEEQKPLERNKPKKK